MYQQLNKPYCNPFIWTLVGSDDFLYLIEHYKDIRFGEYTIEYDEKNKVFVIVIDKRIKVCFPHHIQDGNYDKPFKVPNGQQLDVRYAHMKEYICDLYDRRVKRMFEKPIFVIDDKENTLEEYVFKPTIDYLKKIEELKKTNTIITSIYEKNNIYKNLKDVIVKPNKPSSTTGIARLILKDEKVKKLL